MVSRSLPGCAGPTSGCWYDRPDRTSASIKPAVGRPGTTRRPGRPWRGAADPVLLPVLRRGGPVSRRAAGRLLGLPVLRPRLHAAVRRGVQGGGRRLITKTRPPASRPSPPGRRRPALLAVAHGSKDPAATAAIGALARQVSRLAPVLDVQVAFLQHAEPSLAAGLASAGSDSVLIPLLLSAGYHLTADIAVAASVACTRVAPPLGPDSRLVTALAGRLAEAGVPAGTAVVLAAAGSSDPRAAQAVAAQAGLLARRL